MAIYDFFLSRNGGTASVANYVGHAGRLFYDPAERVLRISDGVTAGGEVFNGIVTVTNLEPTDNFQGQIWLNPEDSALSVYHNGEFIPTIDVATSTKLGGVKLGPGVTVNSEGQIVIDSSNLDFNFGDFEAITGFYSDSTAYALLSSTNVDEDIVIASNGAGSVKAVGQFDIYKTNGSVTASLEDEEPFFRVKEDGQVRMLVPAEDPVEGAVEIIGSASGNYIPPGQPGAMLQITGNPELPARIYLDGNAEYASFVARRFNGTVAAPTAVLANEDVLRINATAATTTGVGSVALAQIRITALENQTPTAQGSKITFTATPIGSAASARVDVATITTADGVSATKFTTAGTVTATGGVSDSLGNIRSIPINNKVAGYILAVTDNGQMISITTGGVTINTGVFASPFGQSISIYNNSASSQTITQGAGVTLRLAGTTATGNRTLARYGVATIVCVASETFVISGAGLV